MEPIRHILVATDGSDGSLSAAELGGYLARDCNSRVSIVAVHSEAALLLPRRTDAALPGSVPFGLLPRKEAMQHVQTATNEHIFPDAKRALGVVPGGVEFIQLWGHTTEKICNYARDNGVDLIVVGRRGRGSFKSLMLGGVSSQLTLHAPCAVAVAP